MATDPDWRKKPRARPNPPPPIKLKNGRPTVYEPGCDETARRLTLLKFTEEQLAEFFGIRMSTLKLWYSKHPSFKAARDEGKDSADGFVVNALMQRALGYTHKSEKIFLDRQGQVVRAETTEHYPPDATSAMFWLANRHPDKWRLKPGDDGEAKNDTFVVTGGLPDDD